MVCNHTGTDTGRYLLEEVICEQGKHPKRTKRRRSIPDPVCYTFKQHHACAVCDGVVKLHSQFISESQLAEEIGGIVGVLALLKAFLALGLETLLELALDVQELFAAC